MTAKTYRSTVHFGGPDLPRGVLRDLLEARVDAVPAGGEISWATYYFRDRALAQALIRAKRRGVRVRLVVEKKPRRRGANASVIELLESPDALGRDLRRFDAWIRRSKGAAKPHLHCKIYYFSHPEPSVWIGSFNPSGDGIDDDREVIEAIGDQDAGHNLLVEHRDPHLAQAMRRHIGWLRWLVWPGAVRHLPGRQRTIATRFERAWFFPRRKTGVVDSLLGDIAEGQRVRVAMSHIKSENGLRVLCDAARRGAQVRVILHHTERRAPPETEAALRDAGAEVFRYRHPSMLPMHAKFMLIDGGGDPFATYGSLNLNPRSLLINHEVFVASRDPEVFAQLDDRWRTIEAECFEQKPGTPASR